MTQEATSAIRDGIDARDSDDGPPVYDERNRADHGPSDSLMRDFDLPHERESGVLFVALEGGTQGGNGASREVFPPGWLCDRRLLQLDERGSRAASASGNCKSSCRLQPVVVGRRSVPPA